MDLSLTIYTDIIENDNVISNQAATILFKYK